MQIYDQDSKPLEDLLGRANDATGATLLVPDLQRPYVWEPEQVTLLIDSLLRGWPFGSLLLWDIAEEDAEPVPSRPFWRIVDRVPDHGGAKDLGRAQAPARFSLVLDGQQRLQSLLLAFGSDDMGFRLTDRDWKSELGGRARKGKTDRARWAIGNLCLDLVALRDALASDAARAHGIDVVDFRELLRWVVPLDADGAHRVGADSAAPIPLAGDEANRGRYVRLSRLWRAAQNQASTVARYYREPVAELLRVHGTPRDVADALAEPLTELVAKLREIQEQKVPFLFVKERGKCQQLSEDAYADAVVSIFTRLNAAGRTLTRQEITFAWVKTGWDASAVDGRSASDCFEALLESLERRGATLDLDALVSLVATQWAVTHRGGTPLSDQDLLRGDIVKRMAADVVAEWRDVEANAAAAVDALDRLGLRFGLHYFSTNVLSLLVAWRMTAVVWARSRVMDVPSRDAFERRLDDLVMHRVERWMVLSQWSGRWSKRTDQARAQYTRELAALHAGLRDVEDQDDALDRIEALMDRWIDDQRDGARDWVRSIGESSRNRVRQYFLPLWIWHHLEPARAEASSIVLRDGTRKKLSHDVDHIVAIDLWKDLARGGGADTITDDDRNSLGGCLLLEKSFNISKSKRELRAFLEEVHPFRGGGHDLEPWFAALGIEAPLHSPKAHPPERIRDAIAARDQAVRAELEAYVRGERDTVRGTGGARASMVQRQAPPHPTPDLASRPEDRPASRLAPRRRTPRPADAANDASAPASLQELRRRGRR